MDGAALGKAALFTISANIAAMIDDRAKMLGRDIREDELEPVTFQMANLGRTVPMVELAHANNIFQTAAIAYEHFLDAGGFDMTLSPTLMRAPEKLGVMALTEPDTMGEAVQSFAPHCAVFNQMGAPAMSVPLHWTGPTPTAPSGLPLGMMFGSRYGTESLLFALAGQLERSAPWAHRKPPVWVA
jgi:amidase